MKPKLVKNIQTTICGEEVGNMVVTWDMLVEYDIPEDRHPDDTFCMVQEYRSVRVIKSVEMQLFNKVGIDMMNDVRRSAVLLKSLGNLLLEQTESQRLEELGGEISPLAFLGNEVKSAEGVMAGDPLSMAERIVYNAHVKGYKGETYNLYTALVLKFMANGKSLEAAIIEADWEIITKNQG